LILHYQVCCRFTPTLCLPLDYNLEHHINHPHYDNCPLPFDFTPSHLWVQLQQRALFIGFQGPVTAALQDNQCLQSVHQLSVPSLLDDLLTIGCDHLVPALTSTSPACFFCHDPLHLAPACPLLLHTKFDPFARRLIICLLQDQHSSVERVSSSQRPPPSWSSCSSSHSNLCIHALLTDPSPAADSGPLLSSSDSLIDDDVLPDLFLPAPKLPDPCSEPDFQLTH